MDKEIQKLLLALLKEELFEVRYNHYSNIRNDEEEKILYQKVVEVRKRFACVKANYMTNKEILEELCKQRDLAEMKKLECKDDEKKLKEIKEKLKKINNAIEKTIIEISKTEDITERGIKL